MDSMRIVIIGGGTAGWMTAVGLTRAFKPEFASVRLIESDEIGIVGVGEATLPQVRDFNEVLGLNEAEFMRETNATFKLGIEFCDWAEYGDSYIHPFGIHGQAISNVPFFQCYQRVRQAGHDLNIDDFSYPIVACRQNKFDFPSTDQRSIRSTYSYAYHFDAFLYARYLRKWAEAQGLKRTEGKVVDVTLRPEDGHIQSVTLASGEIVEGDLFIDCSGFRGLLIGDALQTVWEDWTQWLPCDRAFAVPCDRSGDFTPYTRATAREAGWQWRIPLQHRTGNGYVFSSQFTTEERAAELLLANLDGKAQADPRLIKFKSGRRQNSWQRNCIAIGLASGFLEPLESTSIYLSQIAITTLIELFPRKIIDPRLASEFNRRIDTEYDRVRDFLILHYRATVGRSEELWRYTQNMRVPDSLLEKIEIFRRRGYIHRYRDGLFSPASWIAVYTGQRIVPEGYDRQADNLPLDVLMEALTELKQRIDVNVAEMASHADFVRDFCFDPNAAHGTMKAAMEKANG